jgi:hypothetical protein
MQSLLNTDLFTVCTTVTLVTTYKNYANNARNVRSESLGNIQSEVTFTTVGMKTYTTLLYLGGQLVMSG